MNRKTIGSWLAYSLLTISSVLAGCSGADGQAAPGPDTAEQELESTPCAAKNSSTEWTSDELPASFDGNVVEITLRPKSPDSACQCCETLLASGRQACAAQGKKMISGVCSHVCGLCGCDNAYDLAKIKCG